MLTFLKYKKLVKKRIWLLSIILLKMAHQILVLFFKLFQAGLWIFIQLFARIWSQIVLRLDRRIRSGWSTRGSLHFNKSNKLLIPFQLTRQQFKSHDLQKFVKGTHKLLKIN